MKKILLSLIVIMLVLTGCKTSASTKDDQSLTTKSGDDILASELEKKSRKEISNEDSALTYLTNSALIIRKIEPNIKDYTDSIANEEEFVKTRGYGHRVKLYLDEFADLKPTTEFKKVHDDFVNHGISDMKLYVDLTLDSLRQNKSGSERVNVEQESIEYWDSYNTEFEKYTQETEKIKDLYKLQPTIPTENDLLNERNMLAYLSDAAMFMGRIEDSIKETDDAAKNNQTLSEAGGVLWRIEYNLDNFANLKPTKEFKEVHNDFVKNGINNMKLYGDSIRTYLSHGVPVSESISAKEDSLEYKQNYNKALKKYNEEVKKVKNTYGLIEKKQAVSKKPYPTNTLSPSEVYNWVQKKYDEYDVLYNRGNYSGDKYTTEIFNEAASHFNATVSEIRKAYDKFRY